MEPSFIQMGAATLLGVGLSKVLTQVSVARARAAGFEMVWRTPARELKAVRGRAVELELSLHNRDSFPTEFSDLTVTHASGLTVSAHPPSGSVPAHGSLSVRLKVVPERVGYHGIHGLTLCTIRAPGLFTVPLGFTSPIVIEVLPRTTRALVTAERGARERNQRGDGRFGQRRGDGAEFLELRDHTPSDPYRKISWKASARRGKLLVAEKEREERDSAWVVLDASLETASGSPGEAPLDHTIDSVARLLEDRIRRGDRVGLSLFGARELIRVPLGTGLPHLAKLQTALIHKSHTCDWDRSEWDEEDAFLRVREHLKSLEPRASDLPRHATDAFWRIFSEVLLHAPVRAGAPEGRTRADQELRRYLLSFGIQCPPRGVPERHRAERELAQILKDLSSARPRPSVIHLFSRRPTLDTPEELLTALSLVPKRKVRLHFHVIEELPEGGEAKDDYSGLVRHVLRTRHDLETARVEEFLKERGIWLSSSGRRVNESAVEKQQAELKASSLNP